MSAAGRWSVGAGREPVPGAVALVLTDIPDDGRGTADACRGLAAAAERWLGPEGFCVVGCCPGRLPELLGALAGGPLEYVWTDMLVGGPAAARSAADAERFGLRGGWRPLVILRKGKIKFREWMADVISYDWTPNGGETHTWRADVSPLQKLIRGTCEPGALVADPFCGPDAAVGIAALSTGRRFFGRAPDDATAAAVTTRLAGWRPSG